MILVETNTSLEDYNYSKLPDVNRSTTLDELNSSLNSTLTRFESMKISENYDYSDVVYVPVSYEQLFKLQFACMVFI